MRTILKYIYLSIIALIASLQVAAQPLSIDFDKKIILTDSLNLPRNTSVSTLIKLMPEMLQRPGDFILSNYDVNINGMSVGSAVDVALLQLQIVDIEKIEINDSPVSSYQKNGQGGSINIILRSAATGDKSTWGSAGILASNGVDIAPQFNIGYRNDKFSVRGVMLSELYDATSSILSQTFDGDQFLNQHSAVKNNTFRTELLRAYMQYKATPQDIFNLNVSETYTLKKAKSTEDYNEENAESSTQKSAVIQALLEYKHVFNRGALDAKLEYQYTPTQNDHYIGQDYKRIGEMNSNNFSGKLEYKTMLFKSASRKGCERQGELAIGTNFNSFFGDETADISVLSQQIPVELRLTPQNSTYYIMPYMNFTGRVGKLRMKVEGEYQHFKYDMKRMETSYSTTSNTFTGVAIAEWHFTPKRNLRVTLERKLQRPSSDQLYPYTLFDPTLMKYVQGNPNLKPIMVHEIALDFLDSYKWNGVHNLTLNAGVTYNKVTDIINGVSLQNEAAPGTMGQTLQKLTYENNGKSRVSSANLMTYYSYNAFTLSVVGNIYHKMTDGDDHCTYYNVSVHPQFNLKDGWNGGVRLIYYSKVKQVGSSLGDSASASMIVGKAWRRFFFFISEEVSILKNSKDITYSGSKRTESQSQLAQTSQNLVGIGMKYTF